MTGGMKRPPYRYLRTKSVNIQAPRRPVVPRALPANRRALTREPVRGGTKPRPWLYERGTCVLIGSLTIRL